MRDSYDKSVKEGKFTEPETFLGEVGAIAVEFGAPGGAIFKGVNAARRFLGGITGFNLFTTPTYSLTVVKWLATKISNVAKRAGTSATVFGATDIVAGGPPCQGFSGIGIRRSYSVDKEQLPSNHLYQDMAFFIHNVKPKMFLFENVEGLLTAKWTKDGIKGEIFDDVLNTFKRIP